MVILGILDSTDMYGKERANMEVYHILQENGRKVIVGCSENATPAMKKELEKGKVGGSFDDFLKEQGTYEETTERAVKRVLAYQLEVAMKESGLTKVEMAKQLKTSRSQLDRLLDANSRRSRPRIPRDPGQ